MCSVFFQLRNLVANLTKKTYKASTSDIAQLVKQYGYDAQLHLLRCLVEEIDFRDHKSQKDQARAQLFTAEILRLQDTSSFSSLLCQAIERAGSVSEDFLTHFVKVTKLSLPHQISLAVGLVQAGDASLQTEGLKFLKAKISDFCQSQQRSLNKSTLYSMWFLMRKHEGFSKQLSQFTKTVKHVYPELYDSPLAASFFNEGGKAMDSKRDLAGEALSLSEASTFSKTAVLVSDAIEASGLIEDLGYGCCASEAQLEDVFKNSPPLNEKGIAQILAMMARTHSGLADGHFSSLSDIGGVTEPPANPPSTWDVKVFVNVVSNNYPKLNWRVVIEKLDMPDFMVKDAVALKVITQAWHAASQEPFPTEVLLRVWNNRAGQISFLHQALSAESPGLDFLEVSKETISFPAGIPPKFTTQCQAWRSIDLVNVLLDLSLSEHTCLVNDVFLIPKAICPQLLFLSLAKAQEKREWSTLWASLSSELIMSHVETNSPGVNLVLRDVWHSSPCTVVSGLVSAYHKNHSSLPRCLDISQELKAIPVIIEMLPFPMAFEFGVLAFTRDHLHLEKWLTERLNSTPANANTAFSRAVVAFLNEKTSVPGPVQDVNAIACFWNAMQTIVSQLSQTDVDVVRDAGHKMQLAAPLVPVSAPAAQSVSVPITNVSGIQARNAGVLSVHSLKSVMPEQNIAPQPRAHADPSMTGVPTGEISDTPAGQAENFPPDIEEEANSYFQKIFTSQQSIEDVINMLKGFKNSKKPREQQIFDCMIHNLLDEYRFFPEYPERELGITAVLFGSLILHNLVNNVYLGIALSNILEALRNMASKKMFHFGVNALEQFKGRLAEWPTYCQHIIQIPHIKQFQPEVVDWIQEARERIMHHQNQQYQAQVQQVPMEIPQVLHPIPPQPVQVPHVLQKNLHVEPPASGSMPDASSAVNMNMANMANKVTTMGSLGGFGSASQLNVDTLLNARTGLSAIALPSQQVQDLINFILNNLTSANLNEKTQELTAIMTPNDMPFLAHYLVAKRASVELNNHPLYLSLIEKIGMAALYKFVLSETYVNVKALFKSELIRTSSTERSLLKNLGSWLGSLTLARNRPILHKDLDMKQLVLDAYKGGLLIAVMPFVAKIMDATKHSKVFKPTQPWVAALLSLLCELHAVPDLKLNLKFEVEVLCRNLNVNLQEVPKSSLLLSIMTNRSTNPDFTTTMSSLQHLGGGSDTSHGATFRVQPGGQAGIQVPYPQPTGTATAQVAHDDHKEMPGQPQPAVSEQPLIPNLAAYFNINITLPLFKEHQHLQRWVPIAIERAIREIINPVVERSVTIACITTRELILKDLASESEEGNIRKAAHLMVQNLAGSLALVTCKDPLRKTMEHQLRVLLLSNMNGQHAETNNNLVEQVVQFVSSDNLELGCSVIEKAAIDKAIRDIDEALKPALQARRKLRESGQPFYDSHQMYPYPAQLPEFLHPKAGGIHPAQMRVYEDFARARQPPQLQPNRLPQLVGAPQLDATGTVVPGVSHALGAASVHPPVGAVLRVVESLSTPQILERYNSIMAKIDHLVSTMPNRATLSADHEIHSLLHQIQQVALSGPNREEAAIACAQKAFRQLFDSPGLNSEVQVAILVCLREVCPRITKELTQWLLLSEDSRRMNRTSVVALIRGNLIVVPEYALGLAKIMDNGRSNAAVEFAKVVTRTLVLEEKVVSAADFAPVFEVLNSVFQYSETPNPEINALLEEVRATTSTVGNGVKERRRLRDRPVQNEKDAKLVGLREKVKQLFEEWLETCDISRTTSQNDNLYARFISQLQQQGMVKGDETTDHFFRTMVELAIENSYEINTSGLTVVNFDAVDAFSKLVVLLVKYLADPINPANTMTRVVLLNKVLAVIARVLTRDCDTRQGGHGNPVNHQRPYFRLFSNLFVDLNAQDPVLDTINLQVLGFFSNTLHSLQPSKVPGFTFAWLELISHRMFMPKLLMAKAQRGWPLFQRLLADVFKFLEPFLGGAELNEPIRLLYKGTLRVLLVLLHDFPEFLCDYHFSFCDVIPPSCIQMRNVILSAFPRNMRLPDPFTPNLKVDLLPEISQPPRILSKYTTTLSPNNLKTDVDMFLKTRGPASFLQQDLRLKLMLPANEQVPGGTRYSAPVINALVLHVGVQAIQTKGVQMTTSPSAPMDIFQWLANCLDTEGRYMFLNAIANQLRFPNNHTHYFSCVLLYLFVDTSSETLQEEITRVLLERLIVNRPHPWGLLITFIELIKNPRYNFWSHNFTRSAPEIKRLFENVARSCMAPQSQGVVPDIAVP